MQQAVRFKVVSYNVHHCQGLDRRVRPDRIVQVLEELDADVIGLQEVLSIPQGTPEEHQAQYLAEALKASHYFVGENLQRRGGAYGNVVLSRLPVVFATNYDISCEAREPRGCLRADIDLPGRGVFHLFNLHLGLSWGERRKQAVMLLSEDVLKRPDLGGPRIVIGDFNEWTRGLATRMLSAEFERVDMRRFLRGTQSFPALLPFLHLDNIYFENMFRLASFRVHRSRIAMVASDHLPLVAEFEA